MSDTPQESAHPHHRSARERQRRGPMWGCLKGLIFTFGGLLALLVIVIGGGWWYLGTTSFAGFVMLRIEKTLEARLGRDVSIARRPDRPRASREDLHQRPPHRQRARRRASLLRHRAPDRGHRRRRLVLGPQRESRARRHPRPAPLLRDLSRRLEARAQLPALAIGPAEQVRHLPPRHRKALRQRRRVRLPRPPARHRRGRRATSLRRSTSRPPRISTPASRRARASTCGSRTTSRSTSTCAAASASRPTTSC